MVRILLSLLLIFAGASAMAQDRSRAILVLDASGSMWGQIDGVAKITIAQEVIGGLLSELPAEQELGLTAYGHRRKGDCGDIETMIAPGGDQRAAIASAVNAIKPKGKTPLSAAVIQAAEALKYTEEAATVILVSDGRETCDFDPCEVGRRLEEAGVNFTAHVIGFDVTATEDRAQLQCLADETGGTFRSASDAGELAEALEVVAAPPPPPPPVVLTLRAIDGPNGPTIFEGLQWQVFDSDANPVHASAEAKPVLTLDPWTYRAIVTRAADGARAEAAVRLEADQTATLVLPKLPRPFDVTFNAKDGPGGPTITKGLYWRVAEADGAVLLDGGGDFTPTLKLLPGSYRASVLRQVDEAYAEKGFTVDGYATEVLVLPKLPPEPRTVKYRARDGENGKVIHDDLVWDIYDADGNPVLETEITAQGSIKLVPGAYRIEVLRPEDEATASAEFRLASGNRSEELVLPKLVRPATVDAQDSAVAGSQIEVAWTGPNKKDDFVAVVQLGGRQGTWKEYSYTREGSPLMLLMPSEPGEYEIRYVLNKGREDLASRKITVTDVAASVTPPAEAPVGATVPVDWQGPDYHQDFLAVAARGEDKWINYTYTKGGAPAGLQMPPEPGEYDILYVMNQDRRVIARAPITVSAISFAVAAPGTAPAGSNVQVDWQGPDYKNDFIAVAKKDAKDSAWINYTYTKDGAPAGLLMPLEPGTYEIRYVLNQDRSVGARQEIEITAITGSVSGPAQAKIGDRVQVGWEGPDYKGDYVVVAKPDAKPERYEHYTYTRSGSPLGLQMPSEPGSYELRYIAQGRQDMILARQPIEVGPVQATLSAEGFVAAGGNLAVTWEGPDYRSDFIAISKVGDDRWETYSYTKGGSPLVIRAPDSPGTYELRYVMNLDRKVLASQPLEVE
ncbi:von Willebrand factor type A domain protein [Candidatus Rhodobacter oscarellae]|uniref:von Willebrand factor type A domain protein n=1 Tax=Candidatus Rhodobacter oscarellae TaxID=1675527 RepID=A0A0J9ECS2_9RHOB|nr:VWA domain-containing protein [Candidatus Rhodobacter lobularis]KMW60582.1 von Willebrand factor type A domain protein [Candidatus Rhodobacter lobularis]